MASMGTASVDEDEILTNHTLTENFAKLGLGKATLKALAAQTAKKGQS